MERKRVKELFFILLYFPPEVPQWRRKWHPTPVFLENHGQRSLVGCRPEGHTESDTTEAT